MEVAELRAYIDDLRQVVWVLVSLLWLVTFLWWRMPLCPHHGGDCPQLRNRKQPTAEQIRERLFGRTVVSDQPSDDAEREASGMDGDADSAAGPPGSGDGDVPGVVVPDSPSGEAARPE